MIFLNKFFGVVQPSTGVPILALIYTLLGALFTILSFSRWIMPHAEAGLSIPWGVISFLLSVTGAYGYWAVTRGNTWHHRQFVSASWGFLLMLLCWAIVYIAVEEYHVDKVNTGCMNSNPSWTLQKCDVYRKKAAMVSSIMTTIATVHLFSESTRKTPRERIKRKSDPTKGRTFKFKFRFHHSFPILPISQKRITTMSDDNAKKLAGLNLNAGAFTPRAAAKEFVPSWMPKAAPAPAPAAPSSSGIDFNRPPPAAVLNKTVETPAAAPAIDFNRPPPAAVLNKTVEAPAVVAPKPVVAAPKPATPAPKPVEAPKKKAETPKPAAATPAPAAAPEVVEDDEPVDQETLTEFFGKEHMNVIFIGHVDAGKSTMGGRILEASGMIDKRTLEKYEKDAKEAGRDSWYLSWALDTNAEERAKGKTVECGRAYFETDIRRYTILDAPGHKTYVPSMIGGAAQADAAVLVISARKGEFETGFENGGQTREHAQLAKSGGVNKLIVVINKMDDPTVQWSKERYDECVSKLSPFLKANGYNMKTDVVFMPVSGYTGANIKKGIDPKDATWYKGPSLLDYLDSLKIADRKLSAPLRMPISEKYKDMGTVVVGKIEAGSIKKGATLLMMPNSIKVEVASIFNELEEEIAAAAVGDNIRLRLRGIEEEDIMIGFVLCSPKSPIHVTSKFEAALGILDHRNIICAGYTAVLHIHNAIEEITLSAMIHLIDKKTGRKSKRPPQFLKKGQQGIVMIETSGPICLETFADAPRLGRFTLRDEGKTIAIGKVTKLHTSEDG